MNISIHTLNGRDIEITNRSGQLAYTFEYGGKKYGGAVKLTGKKTQDIVDATFQLFTNALETYEAIEKI